MKTRELKNVLQGVNLGLFQTEYKPSLEIKGSEKEPPKPKVPEKPKADVQAKESWEMTREEFENRINSASNNQYSKSSTVDWGNLRGQGKRVGRQVMGGMRDLSLQGKKRYIDILGELPKMDRDNAYESLGNEPMVLSKYAQARAAGFDHNTAILRAYQVTDKSVDAHRHLIEQALSEGKPVPEKVLAEYPELTGQGKTGKLDAMPQSKGAGDTSPTKQTPQPESAEPIDWRIEPEQLIKEYEDLSLSNIEVQKKYGLKSVVELEHAYDDAYRMVVDKKIAKEYATKQAQIDWRTEPEKVNPSEKEVTEELPIKISPDDLPYDRAYAAHSGTSFEPEKRAELRQREYVEDVTSVYNEFNKIAKTPEQKQILKEELERYKENYIKKQLAVLDAASRTVSSFITGPSKFPTARNEKRLQTEHKRGQEFLDWRKQARKSIKKKLRDVRSEDVVFEEDLNVLKRAIIRNVATLKSIEDGKEFYNRQAFVTSLAGKLKRRLNAGEVQLVEKALEFVQKVSVKAGLKKPVFTKRHSIWRDLEKAKTEPGGKEIKTGEELVKEYEGAQIVNNHDLERVQIMMDEIPAEEVRTELKQSGWRFSGKNKAWQRKNTAYAIDSATSIIDKYYIFA